MAGTNIGTAWVSIKPSLDGVQKKIQGEFGKALKGIESSVTGASTIGTALGNAIYDGAKLALSKITDLAKQTMSSAINQMDSVIRTSNALEQMGYESGDVAKKLDQLKKNAKVTAASFGDLSEGFMALTASWKDMDLTADATQALSDAILSFGGTPDQVANAITQISQVDLDGPLDAQTWLSLRNSGLIPVLGTLAKMNNMSLGEFKSALGQGVLSTRDLVNGLIKLDKQGTETQKSLYEIARSNAAKTWSGAWETAKNAVIQSLSDQVQGIWELSGAGEKIIDLGEKIGDSIGPLIEKAKQVAKWLSDNLISKLAELGSALKPYLKVIGEVGKELGKLVVKEVITFLGDLAQKIAAFLKQKKVITFFESFVKVLGEVASALVKIIVDGARVFLEGLGKAMKTILDNKNLIALFTSLATAIAGYTVAVKAADAAAKAYKATQLMMTEQIPIAITAIQQVMATTGSLAQGLTAASQVTTGATSAITGFAGAVGAAILPVTILTGILTAVYTGYELTKTVTMETTLAKQNYQRAVEYVNQASEREASNLQMVTDNTNSLKAAQDELTQATNNVASTEQQRRDALANLDTVAQEHGTTVEELQGKYLNYTGDVKALSDEELALYTAVQNYANAEVRANQALDEQAQKTAEAATQNELLHDAMALSYSDKILDEVASIKSSQGYEAAANKLKEYASAEGEFVNANGQRMKFTESEMAWIAKGVSDKLAAADKTWKSAWDNMGLKASSTAKDVKNAFNKLPSELSSVGANAAAQMSSGFTSGNNAQLNSYYSAGASAAQQIKNGFNNALQIHSPSRVMMKSGRFIAEGVIDGLESMDSKLIRTSSQLAEDMTEAFNAYSFDTPSLATDAKSVFNTVGNQSNARVVQNNIFNVADSFDLQQISSDLGYAVAMA